MNQLTPIEAFLERDWILQAWTHRYGGHIVVAIAPAQYLIEFLQELTGSGDIEACAFDEYVANDGRWLPIVSGVGPLSTALAALAERLAPHVDAQGHLDDRWTEAVRTAYDKLKAAADGEDGIARAIDRGELLTDPFLSRERS